MSSQRQVKRRRTYGTPAFVGVLAPTISSTVNQTSRDLQVQPQMVYQTQSQPQHPLILATATGQEAERQGRMLSQVPSQISPYGVPGMVPQPATSMVPSLVPVQYQMGSQMGPQMQPPMFEARFPAQTSTQIPGQTRDPDTLIPLQTFVIPGHMVSPALAQQLGAPYFYYLLELFMQDQTTTMPPAQFIQDITRTLGCPPPAGTDEYINYVKAKKQYWYTFNVFIAERETKNEAEIEKLINLVRTLTEVGLVDGFFVHTSMTEAHERYCETTCTIDKVNRLYVMGLLLHASGLMNQELGKDGLPLHPSELAYLNGDICYPAPPPQEPLPPRQRPGPAGHLHYQQPLQHP